MPEGFVYKVEGFAGETAYFTDDDIEAGSSAVVGHKFNTLTADQTQLLINNTKDGNDINLDRALTQVHQNTPAKYFFNDQENELPQKEA